MPEEYALEDYDLYPAVTSTTYDFAPEIRQALAKSMELRNTVVPMTTADRNNLLPEQLWDGRTIVNITTKRLERYDVIVGQWFGLAELSDLANFSASLDQKVSKVGGDTMEGPLTVTGDVSGDWGSFRYGADLGGSKLYNVGTPIDSTDGTNKQYVDSVMPVIPAGIMMPSAANIIPPGWFLCNGGAASRTDYANLFNAIGTTYGVGDGSTTFNIPNMHRTFPMMDVNYTPGVLGGGETHRHQWPFPFTRSGGNWQAITANNPGFQSIAGSDLGYLGIVFSEIYGGDIAGAYDLESWLQYSNIINHMPPHITVLYLIKY